ncbi:MAG TPA: YigZ family protein [Anaerolineaceae bacterium]|nr:YigZ family protein [Anaerolineaceae bacterium]
MDDPIKQRLIPLEPVQTEILVVNSRFIADLEFANSVEAARAHLGRVREQHPSATHNVPAFIIGHGNSIISHCSDDGEPSGTAGRPALAVLQGSGLGNVSVVVTRYFGGTKLGTGGLVRAYGDAVREVLKGVMLATLLPTTTLMFVTPYRLYDQALRLMEDHHGQILDTEFFEDVTVTARFKDEEVESFISQLGNLSAGQVRPIVIEQNPEGIFKV